MPSQMILLVDDNPENLNLLISCLEEVDFRVAVAQSGEEVLERIACVQPDLILLDVMMSGMNGFETCRRLKTRPALKDIPVIFMTVMSDMTDKAEGFEAGGVDYIVKPFQPEEVVARVKTHLTICQLQQQLQAQNIRLQENNARLQAEIVERTRIETELKQYQDHLQELVDVRTRDLTHSNILLQEEIEQRKRMEQTLRISEQQYRALAENFADGIAIVREDRYVFVNPALAAIVGHKRENTLLQSPAQLLGNDFTQRFQGIQDHPDAEQRIQNCCLTAEQQTIWTDQRYRRITWEGRPALLVTVRDITAEKSHEIELEQERTRLEQENLTLRTGMRERYKFGSITGRSPVMQEVYETVAKAAASDANVLLCGESGTGKEIVARTIHSLSKRKQHNFVPVNCGAVPETLFEREFFGHRKGAFTGAAMDKPGYFDHAHGGTLFLDEVAELPPTLQVKLLRALEYKEYTPIGATRSKQVDVRIISATNKNLKTHLSEGLIREDFFYRIRVLVITLPPLRERREDIPLLVEHFLSQYGYDQSIASIPGKIMDTLRSYHWPGNVRELQNEIQRYLAEQRLEFIGNTPGIQDDEPDLEIMPAGKSFREAVEAYEKCLLLEALTQNAWHQGKTAKMLQLPPRTLYEKIKKYQLKVK